MPDIDDQALHWALRQAGQPLDAQEQAAFEAWFDASPRHQGAYLRALAIQHPLGRGAAPVLLMTDAEAGMGDAARANAGASRRRRRLLGVGGALAAGLAAMAVSTSWYFPRTERIAIATSLGEFRRVELADKSRVSLNSESELVVEMSEAGRQLVLHKGEAWFEVAKDKARPFTVASGDVRVRAVGTAFAVRRQPAGADIMVTEGIVEVWGAADPARRERIAAGTRVVVGGGAGAITPVRDVDGIDRKLAWRTGKLVFQDEPLASAIAEFNRYNRRKIHLADPAVGARTLVGQYRTNQPEDFAKDVELLFRVPVRIEAGRILIGQAEDRASRRR